MSAELLSTILSAATLVVIGATAIAALVQLRHLRASNQLHALLTLMKMWNDPELHQHISYIRGPFQERLKDPSFLAEFELGKTSRSDHPELLAADFWEQVGTFMKYGLMDEASWLDAASSQIINSWNGLEPAITAMRLRSGPSAYENFEYAAVRATLWVRRLPDGNYPAGLPRMRQLKADDQTRNAQPADQSDATSAGGQSRVAGSASPGKPARL
jgi:hypothetical protein